MKSLISSVSALLFVFTLVIDSSAQEVVRSTGPACFTEQAMAKMSPQKRSELIAASTSFQSAELMVFVNFDGAQVVPGNENAGAFRSTLVSGVRNCPAPNLTTDQKSEVLRQVMDDYSPFNVRLTTNLAEFQAYPANAREMVIVTTTPNVIGMGSGVAGVSPWAGPGFRIPNSISFVFASVYGNSLGDISSTISHESGHQLGLDHQHRYTEGCGFVTEYEPGFGAGPLAFSPIMGSGLAGGVSNWFATTCVDPHFGHIQNDYSMISDQVAVRSDDFPNSIGGSIQSASPATGVLETGDDVDYMRINFRNPGPLTVSSDNIDLRVTVYNGGGRPIASYNDPDSTNVVVPMVRGMSYLRIEGEGNANMASAYMTGTYTVSF